MKMDFNFIKAVLPNVVRSFKKYAYFKVVRVAAVSSA
jgi:hypothetical protein